MILIRISKKINEKNIILTKMRWDTPTHFVDILWTMLKALNCKSRV